MRARVETSTPQLSAIEHGVAILPDAGHRTDGRLGGMPLRRRLVVAISLVMVVTLGIGLMLTYAHARRKVGVEMSAAMVGGRHIVEREVEELDATPEASRDLPGLVRVFNGHRHIQARLVDAAGQVIYASSLDASESKVPALLLSVLGGPALIYRREVSLAPGQRGAVVLETDARSEVGEVSGDAALDLTVLLILFVLVLIAVNAILTRALASFDALALAFERIGRGDYAARVAETGPPEFARLSRNCNDMARQLGRMDAHAKRLGLQLSTVQEEERAELARNLHDEVSPQLFAVDVDATVIRDRALDLPGETGAVIAARAGAIREAASDMKKQVRMLLGRLRPPEAPDLGLADAVEDLLARARIRHPDVAIRANIAYEPDDAAIAALLHGLVREALSNALQHGRPGAVAIDVAAQDGTITARILDDGGGFTSPRPAQTAHLRGYGILGMRERVEARGGRFSLSERPDRKGILVEAVLPDAMPTERAVA